VRAVSFSPISDATSVTLSQALDGLQLRQEAITANVANLETPGYLSREVEFESSLRAAIAQGDPRTFAVSEQRSLAATRLNGNNVNIDREILLGQETTLRQRLVIQGLNSKYSILRTAISGR
jgi:flagellar basal-body rod protein FlgB